MKTLLIIVGVLAAIIAMSYGFDANMARKFHEDFLKCNKQLGKSPPEANVDTVLCAVDMYGLRNEKGEFRKEAVLQAYVDLISDDDKRKLAKIICHKCYDYVTKSGATGDEQGRKITNCCIPTMYLLDEVE
ncbi:uncharacterized protein LOC112589265 isoform X1 [Harpegnathos saltator]|uniref:uncharacterized protein LOC112589260 isoform X1 n=1 Tax=Harpegnathos saltator TaxID=610380 RepID=UPI000DBED809|nr:uncharacterized protein LOC112589260 isoform X1 [Harpegnathos saltator]XP_025157641.1 uncharacterized protein LOC112589265 isoform X1 [Harpegnathos saltator]